MDRNGGFQDVPTCTPHWFSMVNPFALEGVPKSLRSGSVCPFGYGFCLPATATVRQFGQTNVEQRLAAIHPCGNARRPRQKSETWCISMCFCGSKLGTQKLWMVNTKLDIHTCGSLGLPF